MARRTSDELWKAHQTPNKRGEGSVFYVEPTEKKKGFWRATKTVSWDPITKKAIQVTGSGQSAAEAIARRDANLTKALARAGKIKKSDLPMSAKDTRQTFETVLWEWLKWKQTLPLGAGGIRLTTQKSPIHK